MADLKFVNGDILNTRANIIVQSVNHRKVMGSGLARQIRNKYPDIINGYISMCNSYTFRSIMERGLVYWHSVFLEDGSIRQIACVFGQEDYGTDKKYTNYLSLANGINSVFSMAEYHGYSVAIPYGIGCGLGGGSWEIVLDMIMDTLKYYSNLGVYIYKKTTP